MSELGDRARRLLPKHQQHEVLWERQPKRLEVGSIEPGHLVRARVEGEAKLVTQPQGSLIFLRPVGCSYGSRHGLTYRFACSPPVFRQFLTS